jgi:hypothetical protein
LKKVFIIDKTSVRSPIDVVILSPNSEPVALSPVVRAVKMVIDRLIGLAVILQKAEYVYRFHQ